MSTNRIQKILQSAFAASALLVAGMASAATVVNLTAQRATTTLPDGTTVPMWQFCGAADASSNAGSVSVTGACPTVVAGVTPAWAPGPTITVVTGDTLTINLTNSLTVPTSFVVLGQGGGGLGVPATMASPTHNNAIGVTGNSAVSNIKTISVLSGVVSVTTYTPHGLTNATGQNSIQISGVTASAGFNGGPFTVTVGADPNAFTYADPLATGAASGGSVGQLLPASQLHNTFTGNGPSAVALSAPAQGPRVRSFGTEVKPVTLVSGLTWTALKPGTYIYETGTLPSLEVPMGLYGLLVVTQAPVAATAGTLPTPFVSGVAYTSDGTAAGTPVVSYDSDAALLFSEIDPVQNSQVDKAAVAGTAIDANLRFNDPACIAGTANNCYPAAVNYTPTYFLINGNAYDRTAPPALSSYAVGASYSTGNVLVRLANAGSRTHIPTIVGLPMALVAEDGHLAPGVPKIQSEALLTAGKVYDAIVNPAVTAATTTPVAAATYTAGSFALFDRQGSLSTGNQSDGGMQAYLLVNGGAAPAQATAKAVDDFYAVAVGGSITFNVRANDIGVKSVVASATVQGGTLVTNLDGTLTYTAPVGFNGADTFTYTGNGGTTNSATVTLTVGSAKGAPAAVADTYCAAGTLGCTPSSATNAVPNVASVFIVSAPGLLTNDTDPANLRLSIDTTSITNTSCGAVTVRADGSFTATRGAAQSCSFTYNVKNSQGTLSAAPATVNVTFPLAGSGLALTVVDATTGLPTSGVALTDYRWTIQEDLTFKHDTGATPSLSTRTLGTSFHRAHNPVIATGCWHDLSDLNPSASCGAGQQKHADGGAVVTIAAQTPTPVSDVVLDPTKHYYISILPGDAQNPAVNAGGGPVPVAGGAVDAAGNPITRLFDITKDCSATANDPADPCGHIMGGVEVGPQQIIAKAATIKLQKTPLTPAQLSIFIYNDNNPANGQIDANEVGLGGFNIIIVDPAGRSGDPAGQQTYDSFNMPLNNALLGRPGCPDDQNSGTNGPSTTVAGNLAGVIYTCPNDPNEGTPQADPVKYALAGHALVKNLTPARYDVIAHPGAAREGAGEEWWQTETLEGTPAQDAFTGLNEPVYFQEFGPPGFHTTIGFVQPKPATVPVAGSPGATINGAVTSQHMSRPSNVSLLDAGTYDLLSSTNCRVALNSGAGIGSAVQVVACNPDGTFSLTNVQAGDYEVQVFDQWLDQIIQARAVTITAAQATAGTAVPMPGGHIQALSWFTQHDQNLLLDDGTGVLKGIPNEIMSVRYRNGAMSNQTATDANGNGILVELFPLFNWYVSESNTTRFKQKQVNITVDGGGQVETTGSGAHLWSSKYATGESSVRTEFPGAVSYGIQGFISERNQINWIRTPYAQHENGGIQGHVVLASTRPYDDQRMDVQNIWEPLVPRVTINLYSRTRNADGTYSVTLVDTTTTSSFDDFVNTVLGSDNNTYLLGQDGVLRNPVTGVAAAATVTVGRQVNLQCPGQLPGPAAGALPPFNTAVVDPFTSYTLGGDQFRCYDGFHNWNQVQPAPYDGRYEFPSAAYVTAHALTAAQRTAGQTLVSLPVGDYVVEMVTPTGYQVVKEEDKDILTGDAFVAPVVQQFGGLSNIFILPDQATLNNANANNPGTGDLISASGLQFQSDPTSNLGVIASAAVHGQRPADCVGATHRVPDFLSLYPQAQLVAPFAGMDRALCDKKLVKLGERMQTGTDFFVYTEAPVAANATGIILDDASAEFNAASPDFGEKASVPFIPVSTKDFTGNEVSRTYSDQWGAYNLMLPSSWLVNPPTPSGYGPNMLVNCINDPGPIPATNTAGQFIDASGAVVATAALAAKVTDPAYNPGYSNFCYTNPFMPGQATYLDTPLLPIAAFAAGYNPPDCAYPDSTPAIKKVDSSVGFGPYLPAAGGTLTITALGNQDVPNPAYSGPFALTGLTSQSKVTRHYGFGTTAGTVTIGGVSMVAAWSDATITVTVPTGTVSGELVVTAVSNSAGVALGSPISTTDAVTVTIGGSAPKRVSTNTGVTADFATIQAAIDAATPGDLILVDAGHYNELVVMWKPVRLQGDGAASVVINAAKYPTSKLELWRPTINQMFGVDSVSGNGVPNPQVDPLPSQTVTGGLVLLEPTVLGTEEGAGITVLAKDPSNIGAACGSTVTSSYFDSTRLDVSGRQGTVVPSTRAMSLSNFTCAASRIDGLSVTGGDAGGGIYVNGWAHNLEIANNKVYGNAGAYNGGVRIGIPYLELEFYSGQTENANGTIVGRPTVVNGQIKGFGYDNGIKIHNNAITKNGTVEAPRGGGGAGGGVSICTGTDGYSVDHNWICGNYSSADGGGVGHIGFSQGGSIADNQILYNQAFQQTTSVHGGGIVVEGEPPIAGTLSLGSGSVAIERNVIVGNFAEVGHGGGVRLQQVNGADVAAFNTVARGAPGVWNHVTLNANVIERNEAGWSGGGVSLSDTLASSIGGGDVAHNDTTGSAGVLIGNVTLPNTTGAPERGLPNPAGISTELTSNALRAAFNTVNGVVKNISSPVINGVRISKNRSFYYRTALGNSTLCSSNNNPVGNPACAITVPDQTATGQCTGTPAYWDLGVVGNDNVNTAGNGLLQPINSQLTATDPAFYFTLAGNTPEPTTDTVWCNGSRVVPEFPNVINPPSVNNLQVAATVDEGNNFISVRYGPLYGPVPAALPTAGADLAITKNDAALVVFAGAQNVVYTISVANNGPLAVTNAAVTDTLPGAASFVVTGWTCTAVAPNTCTATASNSNTTRAGVVSLQPGGSATFTLTGNVRTTATGTMTNVARIAGGGQVDPVPSNNVATNTNTIVAPGVLAITPTSFGAVEVLVNNATNGFASLNRTLNAVATFTNNTPLPMTLRTGANGGAAVTTGPNAGNFAVVTGGSCTNGATVLAGANCTVLIQFTPTTTVPVPASRTATLRVFIQELGTNPAATVTLGGGGTTGAPLTQVVKLFTSWTRAANTTNPGVYGNTSGAQTITVTNTTGAALTLSAAPLVSNVIGTQFKLGTGSTCGGTTILTAAAPGNTCTVVVTRTRPAAGNASATLTLTSAGANTQPTVAPTQILGLTGN